MKPRQRSRLLIGVLTMVGPLLVFIFMLQSLPENPHESFRSVYQSNLRPVPGCIDTDTKCQQWTESGECDKNPDFMYEDCPASCGGCTIDSPENSIGKSVVLSPAGTEMPTIGFGTAGLGQATSHIVTQALDEGYRRIDTAQAQEWYREELVGLAIGSSKYARDELFITTKVHPRDFGEQPVIDSIYLSLTNLQTDYIDLVLLHYSQCYTEICGDKTPVGDWKASWRALELLVGKGIIKAIGVSNFAIKDLAELVKFANIQPSLVQMNSDPLKQNRPIQAFCRSHGIQFEGYSTLGGQYLGSATGGADASNPIIGHPLIKDLAATYGVAPGQIVLRWALQQGQTVIPRTTKVIHMRENLDLFGFSLTDEDMLNIINLDTS